jgi:hypothetical protein
VVTYLSIIGRLLRGLEVPVLFVGSGRGGRVSQRSFNDNIALLYGSSDFYVQPEDGLTGRG